MGAKLSVQDISESELAQFYEAFDTDNSGTLSLEEMMDVLYPAMAAGTGHTRAGSVHLEPHGAPPADSDSEPPGRPPADSGSQAPPPTDSGPLTAPPTDSEPSGAPPGLGMARDIKAAAKIAKLRAEKAKQRKQAASERKVAAQKGKGQEKSDHTSSSMSQQELEVEA